VIIGAAAIYTASRSDGGKKSGRLGRQRTAAAAASGTSPAAPAAGDDRRDTP
jgi:hypothetical protein